MNSGFRFGWFQRLMLLPLYLALIFCLVEISIANDSLVTLDVNFKEILSPSFPDKGMYSVQEEIKDKNGIIHKNNFNLYVTKNYQVTGIEYLKGNTGDKGKRIIFLNYAEDIWTLDEKGGRLRKKSYTQRLEPMNFSDITYWDYFLTPLINPYFKVLKKSNPNDTIISYRLLPDEKCYYKKIKIYVHAKEQKITKILLYRNMHKIAKKIQFHYLPKPNQKLINQITLENLKTGAQTTWTIKQHLSEKELPQIFKEGLELF